MNSEDDFGIKTCCAIRRNLANEFAIGTRLYSEAAEEARVAFEEHIAAHGC